VVKQEVSAGSEELIEEQIDQAIAGKKLVMTTHSFLIPVQMEIEKVLHRLMQKLSKGYLAEHLAYGVRELGVNAKRANTKRIYFAERGLNIKNSTDYQLGMQEFKHDILTRHNYYIGRLREENRYIRVEAYVRRGSCYIGVINNSRMLSWERMKIKQKLKMARTYDSLDEVYSEVMDDSEGAGLGIVVLLLMLRRAGISEDHFKVFVREEKTIARIEIPLGS
jgi:hypothetical protein